MPINSIVIDLSDFHGLFHSQPLSQKSIIYSYLVSCCPISDLFGKGEPILGEVQAEPNIGSPLPNKSDIGQAADQTAVLLFPPRILVLLIIRVNYFKS